ncbi:MAG TPA: hypothetical protein VM571_11220 [Noviherbaspirillum sp.]|nr:hypothetical protein [Noviherbaspirillum sp.]
MRPSFPNRSLINALDLASSAKQTAAESAAPAAAVEASKEPPQSKEWNKGLSMEEQRRLYRTAGQYAVKARLAQELEARFGKNPYLSKKEFNAVDGFRMETSNRLNNKLRNGDTRRSTLNAEKTINSGLEKLADQGCRANGIAVRGISAPVVNRIHKAVQEGQTYTDDGIPFFTPDKETGLEYTRPLAGQKANPDTPGMLLHALGESGAYSLNPNYPDIAFYKSKTPFDVELKAFDEKNEVYKALLVEKTLGKTLPALPSRDITVPASSIAHVEGLTRIAKALDARTSSQEGAARLQDNIAVAMQHMSPHSLRRMIKAYVDRDDLKHLAQDFPLTYRRPINGGTIREMLSQELQALFPEEVGTRLMQKMFLIALSPERTLVHLDAQAVGHAIDRVLQDPRIPSFLRNDLHRLEERTSQQPYSNAVGYTFFDAIFDLHFAPPEPGAKDDLKVARYLVKREMKKDALSLEHYLELRVDTLIRETTANGTARGGEQERFALLEKFAHLLSPLTPGELTTKILPHIKPKKLDALNAALERRLSDTREALLERQLAQLPRNAATEHLFQQRDTRKELGEEAKSAARSLGIAKARLLHLKREVDRLAPPVAPTLPAEAPKAGGLSSELRAYTPRSAQALQQAYPGITRAMMGRMRAMEENKSSGRIYADAARIGIAPEHIDRMLARQVPLAFPDQATYRQFQQELQTVLEQCGLGDCSITSGGTATDFYSKNPRKPAGWHFDTPQSEKPSDLDLFITGPGFLNVMRARHAYSYPPREFSPAVDPAATARLPQRLYPWTEVMKHFPELVDFVRNWEHALGREITVVGMSEGEDPTVREFIVHAPSRGTKQQGEEARQRKGPKTGPD